MSSNMERVAAMPDASLYVNRDGRRADDCVDSHGGGNLTKIPRSGGDESQKSAEQRAAFDFFERYLFKGSFKRLEIGRYPLPFLVNSLVKSWKR